MNINPSIKLKKPPTPYAIYVKEMSIDLKRQNPDTNMNDIYKYLGSKWHKMTDEDKDKYYVKYERDFIKYSMDKNINREGEDES